MRYCNSVFLACSILEFGPELLELLPVAVEHPRCTFTCDCDISGLLFASHNLLQAPAVSVSKNCKLRLDLNCVHRYCVPFHYLARNTKYWYLVSEGR